MRTIQNLTVVVMLFMSLFLKAQTVQWKHISSSSSIPNYQTNYIIDDSNNIVHLFIAFTSGTYTLYGKTLGPYPNNRNFGVASVYPNGETKWNLVFSGTNGLSSFSPRSITTDGLNYYIVYTSVDTLILRKNNVISDTILQARSLRDLNLIKINNNGELVWVRTMKSLSNFNVSFPVLLSYDPLSKTIRGGVSVFDSAQIDIDENSSIKYVSDRNYRISKCGSGLAQSTFLFAYDVNGKLKKSRVVKNDITVNTFLHSFQAGMLFVYPCDTSNIDGIPIRDSVSNYFALDSGLRFKLLAQIPKYPNINIKFTKGADVSVSSRSELFLTPQGDSLRLGNSAFQHSPFEVLSYDNNNQLIRRKILFPLNATDSVRITFESQVIHKEFIYLSGRGINGSKLRKTLVFDGISYTLNPSSQFSFFMKLDKLLNVLWVNFNFVNNTAPPFYERLGIDKEGNLLFNGSVNGNNQFPLLNDSLPRTNYPYSFMVKVRDQTITRGEVVSGPYCAGDTLLIPYTTTGVFNNNNQFIAQLSNADGSFDDTTQIYELGRITANKADTITGILPLFQVLSSPNYRIRIISTSPIVQSFYKLDSLKLLIYSKDKANPGGDLTICKGDTVELNTFGGTKWTWMPGNLVLDSNARKTKAAPASTTLFTIIISDSSGCGLPDTASKLITVRQSPKATINLDSQRVCLSSEITLTGSFYDGDTSKYDHSWYVLKENNWLKIDSGANQTSDTLVYQLPENITDSLDIALVIGDNCSPLQDTAYHRVYLRNERPVVALNIRDTTLCPGTDFELNAQFNNGDTAYNWDWTWQEYVNNLEVNSDTFSGNNTLQRTLGLNINEDNKQVRLIVRNRCSPSEDTSWINIRAKEPLSITFKERDTTICYGTEIKLNTETEGGNPETHQIRWFSNNQYLSDSSSWTMKADSSVIIRVILNDNCMPENDTSELAIRVRAPLKLENTTSIDTVICFGQSLNLNANPEGGDTTAYSYLWTVNNTFVSALKQIRFNSTDYKSGTDTSASNYIVKLILNDNCTIDNDSLQFDIDILPKLSIDVIFKDSLCYGESDSLYALPKGGNGQYVYRWTDENLQNLAITPFLKIKNNSQFAGDKTYWLKLEDGCTTVGDSIKITQHEFEALKIHLTSNDTCTVNQALIQAEINGGRTGQKTIEWFDNTLLFSGSNSSLNVTTDSVRYLSAVVKDACSEPSDTSKIRIATLPDARILSNDTNICHPSSVEIKIRNTGKTRFSYILEFGDGKMTVEKPEQDSVLVHTFDLPGIYTSRIRLKNTYNCTQILSGNTLYINPRPYSDFTWLPTVPTLDDSVVVLSNLSRNASNYNWILSDGKSENTTNSEFKISDTGNYRVVLIAISDKGCRDSSEQFITVNSNYRLQIPNAFSPNGDGLNDTWIPQAGAIEYMEFVIFNRWGEMIYIGNESTGWDGTYLGVDAPQGIYVYTLKVKSQFKGIFYLSGTIDLIR